MSTAGATTRSTPTRDRTAPLPGALHRVAHRVAVVLPEVAVVVGLLVLLEGLVFYGYFKGFAGPQFDFLGTYNTEAYTWWHDGGFFDPPAWVPYTWGGYPSAISLQNASWYLPVGVPAELVEYDLHIAAMLQALHVAAGALGVYVLARAWGLGRSAATVGLVAGFFAPGFFANAQHVDIVRGYAWAPWLMLILSPSWPWRRWWSVPAAAFLLWQALMGVYPGMLVAFVYVGAVWVLAFQVVERPRLRAYLLPLAGSGVLALLLAMLKFLPAVTLRGTGSPSGAEDSAFDLGILGTVFFPYDGDNLPTDMSMRSFFVPATCMALLALVPWRSRRSWVLAVTGAAAAALSLPIWPWFDLVGELPGLGLSRFRASDFRPFLLLCVVMLALLGLSAAVRAAEARRAAGAPWTLSPARRGAGIYLVALLLVAAGLGVTQHFGWERWAGPWTLLLTAALLVALLAGLGLRRWDVPVPDHRLVAAVLVGLTVTSGVTWAYATQRPWLAQRIAVEQETWGERVEDLIAEREDPAEADEHAFAASVQRPARTPLTQDPVPVVEFQKQWNSAYYTGTAAVGGYTNLKGNEAFDRAMTAFQDEATADDALAFYAAPGIAIAADEDEIPDEPDVTTCAATGRCGPGVTVEPREYAPGHLVYDVSVPATVLQLNESYYPGWQARLCPADGAGSGGAGGCRAVEPEAAEMGNIAVEVPAGDWTLELDYTTPGLARAWQLFWAGALLTVLWTAVAVALGVRAAGHRPPDAERTAPPRGGGARADGGDAGSATDGPETVGRAPGQAPAAAPTGPPGEPDPVH